ncbi:MAG TPA: ABC transporter substrate-binding protein [Terracidiphilus sp.]|nr:ABC transporter substrate-binding protein [Terracidiphilus sp.]
MNRRRYLHLCAVAAVLTAASIACACQAAPRLPGELAWTIGYDPKTFDPAKVDDEESEMVRYLTSGVLLRLNRATQQVEPCLAQSSSLSPDGKTLTLKLRAGLRFSDGSSLTAKDAAWSVRRVLQPSTKAPVAEEFLDAAAVTVQVTDDHTIVIHLPRRVIGVEKVFDEIAIEPADRPSEARVTAGPFYLSDYRRSQYVRLRRNPNYRGSGDGFPRASGVRLDVLENQEQITRLFLRSEYDFIDNLPPDYFELLKRKAPNTVRDIGPSMNTEQMWFNQAPDSPLPEWEKAWFRNQAFRIAVSQAIHRDDLARIAYLGHATPAYSFVSPANTTWFNRNLTLPHIGVADAKQSLARAGFHLDGSILKDAQGHPVRFSILTNTGNSARAKMATLIQQDLAALGIQVTVVTLDFPALIERLMHTQDYEACLLGLENVDPDPNAMMNIWLSSSPNHQWSPSEKTPATAWEAEIDRAMNLQASSLQMAERVRAIDRVQQIVADQQPFIYLVYPNALVAVSPQLRGAKPAVLEPRVAWNVENLSMEAR